MCDRGVNDEAVWRKHSEELVRYASILVGPSDAEDLLSAVVVRVLAAKGSLSALEDARPYLFRAVLNESKNHRRQFRTPPQIGEAVLPDEPRPEVLKAAMALPPQQRAAVYLTYWKDLPIRETASLIGCRPGTVRRYLVLARRHLKEVLTYE
ncbi:MAG TPA: RNA polymerase sigma factor [Acidimicrobiia bacterium]|nr:RNA polymerase sigma factor [Acidimicrobiia bacterium]